MTRLGRSEHFLRLDVPIGGKRTAILGYMTKMTGLVVDQLVDLDCEGVVGASSVYITEVFS